MIDNKHPSEMTEDERAALVASDPEAFDEDTPATDDDNADEVEESPDADSSADDSKPVDQRAFNGVLAELRELRQSEREARRALEELQRQATQTQQQTSEEEPRDFDAERAALRERYNEGELGDDEYEAQREKLLLEQAEEKALARLAAQRAAEASAAAQAEAQEKGAAWDQKIGAWMQQNAEFCSNPLRVDALGSLIQRIGADPELSDDEVLAQVEAAAFEAFNWTPTAAPAARGGHHAARNAADAAATARASAVPPTLTGGVGNRGAAADGIDLASLKPGSFSKLPKAEQERLLGEGALD